MRTVFVDDLDTLVAEIGEREIEPDQRETYSNGVRKADKADFSNRTGPLGLGRTYSF